MIFSPEQIQDLDNHRARQNLTIDLFNTAMDEHDHETAIAIANYVINADEISNKMFSRGWQMHCLNWLTAHYFTSWKQSPDDSEEEETYLGELLSCLWKYKWITASLPTDLSESREDIANAINHMTNLYQDFEMSMAMIHKAKMEQAMLMGEVDIAKAEFAQWQACVHADENHMMNDCEACEINGLVEYYHFIGDYKQAAKLAKPILLGDMSCGEVPHLTYYPAIDSLIQLGETEDAQDYLEDAIEYIRDAGDNFLFIMPKLIQLAVRLNKRDRAEELLDEFSTPIVNAAQNNPFDYLQYLIAVAPFNDEALMAARGLAKDFDERNGNRYYQNQLALLFTPPTVH